MIELTKRIIVSAKPDITYNVLKNVALFSQFIAGVEHIQENKIDGKKSRNIWSINMQGVRIKWEEENSTDDKNRKILFKRISGDFDVFEGSRKVQGIKNGSEVHISLKIDWSSNKKISEDILQKKANLALRWMLRSIREHLNAESILIYEHEDRFKRTIVSELIKYNNLSGKEIVGFFDYLKGRKELAKFIIIPPGYGETKKDSLALSYFLVSNGFNVVRYDNTYHTGESYGDIYYTTLPKIKGDIIATLDYIEKKFNVKKIGVIASSLAARVAIKAATEDSRISYLLCLVAVVNLKGTLKEVYHSDIIGAVEDNKYQYVDVLEILGHEVSRDFAKTAIEENYHNLDSSIEDIKHLHIPVTFIVSAKDAWVRIKDIKTVFNAFPYPEKELQVMSKSMHLIEENPRIARLVFRQIIKSCKKNLIGKICRDSDIIKLDTREIVTQNRIEAARLRRLAKVTKENEKTFWKKYLNKYILITHSEDFRNLLSFIEIRLGAPLKNERILDAGCGNGHFGAWLLWASAIRYKERRGKSLKLKGRKYVGVDFVQDALEDARIRHKEIQSSILKDLGMTTPIIEFEYHHLDLEQDLPFGNDEFDKVCCNLVLPYLKNPYFTLKELFRVLKPGGKIVVTSLKPHPDLSQVYKNFADKTYDETEINEARLLLSSACKIKQKESEGHYHFFSARQLRGLFLRMKAINVKDYKALANQAVAVVAQKSKLR